MMTTTETRTAQRPTFDPQQAGCENVPARWLWAINRFRMETENLKSRRGGGYGRQHSNLLWSIVLTAKWALKISGQYGRGVRNAYALTVPETELSFASLPAAFNGFTLLHLTDLHLDRMDHLVERALEVWQGRSVDLCVLTGDYRGRIHGRHHETIRRMARLLAGIDAREGFVGVLGNHDDCHMVQPLESLGMRLLINESFLLTRGADQIRIIGTDDVHYYYTDQALNALEAAGGEFCIALVHSPELYVEAARLGVDLYLCGHTHGGQIALPGGFAPLRHLRVGRRFYRGLWRHGSMQGLTNCGLGTCGMPIRFNTRGEMRVLRLRRSEAGGG